MSHRFLSLLSPRNRLRALALAFALGLPAATAVAQSVSAPEAKAPFPNLQLSDARSRGQRAIDLLGTRLPEVASWYRKSPEEFRSLLLRDKRLRLDRRGRLFVEEEIDHPLPVEPASAVSGSQSGTLVPLDQTLKLHSRPGAQRTIYLNFMGKQISNTAWNGSTPVLTALPFDFDGVPYSLSAAELERIQYIWQRVAEDFAPFDVNVTTEAPSADLITRSGSGDPIYGTEVLITSRSGVYSCSCGGVAYIGAFNDTVDFYKPALVFYDALGGGSEKYVAEAISHEAGHNLGLLHDGHAGGGYYAGHGSGATGWAPIMGVGYYQPLAQWSKGEYATANNSQDDYVVMASNGLPLRADDHGGTAGTATALTLVGPGSFAAGGVIERPGDVDMFAFSAAAGTVTLSAMPAARSPNVDLKVELRNAAGTVLASANPVDSLPGVLTATLPVAGTYHVAVTGVGKGDPMITGYTNYGSTGQYAVAVAATAVSGQPPVAVMAATPTSGSVPLTVVFSAAGSSDPDGSIVSYAWTFGDGQTGSGPSVSHVYQAAGSFTAELRVTDNTGLSATRSTVITVNPVVTVMPMSVSDIAMGLVTSRRNARGQAVVSVRDGNGNPVPGAKVDGRWSGLVSGNVSGTTGSNGMVTLTSSQTRSMGTFTFTVTGITLAGYAYDSARNSETSDSISR